MKKALLITLMLLFTAAGLMAEQARNIELVDMPTANTMIQGELRWDIKFHPFGGILNRLYIGLFDRLMLGGAFNMRNLIGSGGITFEMPPKFLAKIRITDDDGYVPAISAGYEGEGYMDVPAKGLFIAVTKEFELGVIGQATLDVYTNEFSNFGSDIGVGLGFAFAITREFVVCLEYDGIFSQNHSHINLGLGYFFDPIEIDVGFKYGLTENDFRLARMLKILYITYF